jgi:hypothetical protein
MNGTEQRERFTAVSRAEKRLEAVELVTEGLGRVIVDDRALVAAQFRDVLALCHTASDQLVTTQHALEALREDLTAVIADRQQRDADWDARTLWQRLHFVLTGRA